MATNVAVEKKNNENSMSLLRRFTRRVQGSGVLPRVRGIRYSDRNRSSYVQKKQKLASIEKKKEIEKLIKLGRIQERTRGRRR